MADPLPSPESRPLGHDFFDRDVLEVARDLIGCTLLVDGVGGRIVEVEAYDQDEPAAHSHRGRSERNAVMFGPAGRVYVYRSYGLHWCMNLVCRDDRASAVLLRALEPTRGLAAMAERRGLDEPRLFCAGPGRLCQALGVTSAHDGARADAPPFLLLEAPVAAHVATAPRIGITKATELPWRFCERGSRFLSRPLPRVTATGGGPAGQASRPGSAAR